MSDWRVIRLGDYTRLLTGFPFKSRHYSPEATAIRLLRGDNIIQGRLRWDGAKCWPQELAAKYSDYRLVPGDVVVAMDRPWIEAGLKFAAVQRQDVPSLLVQRVARLRATEGLDQGFLRYVVGGAGFTSHVLSVQTGTAVPHISPTQILDFRFALPPLPEQRAIAEVLGALDDKIDANARAVKVSQDLADQIFTRWRLRLTAASPVPFADLAEVFGGSTPKTNVSKYWQGEHPWAVPKDVTALAAPYLFDTTRHITDSGLNAIGNRLHPVGSIFMTSRATIGAFAVLQRPCAANQGFIVVAPRDPVLRWFLFHEMRSRVSEMLDRANGSTFLELSRGNFKRMHTVQPQSTDLRWLDAMLAPIHAWCAAIVRESGRLIELKNTLLPPLISGKLRVRAGKFPDGVSVQ